MNNPLKQTGNRQKPAPSGYTPVADFNRATNGAGVSSTSGILEQAARDMAATLPEARTPRTTRTYRDGTTRERQDRGAMLRGAIGTRYDTEGSIASGVQRGLGTAAGAGAAAVDALSGLDYLSSNDRKRIENAQKNLETYTANRDAATNEAERQHWQKLADHAQNEIEAYTKGSEAKRQNATDAAEALRNTQEGLFREASEGDYAARAGRALETVEKYGDNTYDDNLAGLIGSNYGVGRLSQNSSYAWNEYLNDPTPENRAIAELYDLALSNTGENNADALTPDNGLETWARSIANYAPQFLDQTAARLKGGAAGLALGSVSAGQAAGSALDMYAVTRGAAFRGLLEAGVPEEQAMEMAKDEALISSIIEYADSVTEYLTLGGKDIVKLLMSGGAELATTTAGKSAGRAAAKKIAAYLANIVQEGEEERSQEAVSIANERRLADGTTDSGGLGLARNALGVYWNEGLNGDRESEAYQQMASAAAEGRRIASTFGAIQAGTGYAANRVENRLSAARGMDFISDAVEQAESGEVSNSAANKILNNEFARNRVQRLGGVTLTDDMTKQEQRDAIKQAAARLAGVSEAEPVSAPTTNDRAEISEPSTPQRMGESEAREALPLRGVSEEQIDKDLADAARLSVTLGRSGANAFLTAYDRATAASVEPTAAFESFSKVYNAAVRGENAPEVSMPEHLRIAAQGAGENDARTAAQAQYFGENAGLAPNRSGRPRNLSRREARVLDAIGKAAGVQIKFADTMNGANASIENGVLTIARDADDPVRAAFTHEIVHRVRESAPEAYSTLAQFVVDNMSDERLASAIRARSDTYSDMNYSISDITEETVADAFGRMASEPELLEKIAGVDRTAAQKILDAIDELLRKIKAALSGKEQAQLTANQIEAFRDLQGRGEEMAKALRAALDKVQEQAQAANENAATEDGAARYSRNVDSEYMAAVERGDMDEAERMVDEAAKAAGYTIKAWHGSRNLFTEFSADKRGSNTSTETSKRWFFAGDRDTANSYYPAGVMAELMKQNPTMYKQSDIERMEKRGIAGKLYSLYLKMENPLEVDVAGYDYAAHKEKADAMVEYIDRAERNGNDGVILHNVRDNQLKPSEEKSTVYMFRDPAQAKSADPVTYDDNGNVISLSQRFNSGNNDIRYSRNVDSEGRELSEAQQDVRFVSKAAQSVGINYDATSESANAARFSRRTWEASDYAKDKKKAAQDLSKALGCSVRTATKFINDVNSIAKMIADDRTRLDYEAAPGASSFVSNVEYGGSIDFSTICKKRRLLTGTIEAIQKAMPNGVLTADEVLKIRETMKERGYEVSCGLCYVEGSRAKMGEFAAEFINLYKKYHPDAEWMPNMYDVNTPTGAENMRVNHPDVYKEYEHFWNHYGTLREGDPNLFASQQKPKLFQAATEYDGEILKKFRNDGTVAEKNKNGGLRLQSFSDFEIIHLIDTMQVIMDMSRVGLAGQAYTKVPNFAWAVGGTGLKVNCSLIAKGVDENGRIILDEIEGMKRADAEALRNAYSKNVGTILVVFNDEQLQAAMNDPFIDFIIPFHRSQWAKRQYEILGLPANVKDYTNYQNEKLLQSGKKGNLMPNEYWDFKKNGKANAERYLELCAENGKRPKFYNLLVNNGDGSYSLQPDGSTDGYWKLLIDFKMYDNQGKGSPQMPVQPKFNMEQAERMLNEYTGGHEQFPVAQDVVDEFVQEKSEGRRFSRKSVADAEEREAALLQENDLLREEIRYWKAQLERTPEENVGIVDPNAVRKTAKKLIADYGSTLAHEEITDELLQLYNFMGTGSDERGELSYESAREIADSVARKIAENAVDDTESAYRMYEDLRSFLRTMDLTVTAAETAEIADWGDWRKQNFGRMQVKRGETSNIDRIYDELSDAWPEFFPGDVLTVGDQLNRIAEVADYLYRDRGHNPYDPYMDQAVIDIGNDIMERFFDLPQAKTFADKQAAKIETLRVQMSELRARDSERLQRSLAKAREIRDMQIERMTERFRAKTEAGRERQSAAKLRKQIMRHTSTLSQKLLRPTDKQHIPDSLRAPVAAMLEAINKESAYDVVTDENGRNKRVPRGEGDVLTKRTQAFAELKKQYAEMKDDENLVIDPDLLGDEAAGFQGLFDQVLAMSGTPIQRMSAEQLQTVWKVVRAVEHSVSTYGKTLSAAKYKTTADWAFRFRSDASYRKDRATIGGKDISLGLENPYTFFSQYGESGKAIFRMLRDAQDTQRRRMDRIADAVHNIADSKTVKELRETRHEFTTERGDTLTLTTAQIMELYNLTKREQAQNHLLKGGIVQPEIPAAGKQKRIERGTEMIRLTQADLGELAALLTPRQTDIADALQQLTATALAEWGNEASMAAYGYRKFTEQNYWPIHTAQEALHSKVENDRSNPRSIKNIGMAKALVPNASNAVSVGDVFTTFAEHAADMIDYSSWLLPMEDANRLFNFKYKGDDGYPASTFKQELDRVGGRNGKAQKYWTDLMADIQNGLDRTSRSDLEGLAARGIGNVKGASVGANLRVIVQQPTAYLRANAVMSPESLTKGLIGGVTRGNGWQKAQQYAAIARIKDVGGFDQGSTRSVSNELYSDRTALEKVGDIAGRPAGKADAVTWGALWNAAEWETKRLNPELAEGSAAFYQKAAEIFTDTIDQTQVVDGVLQRSAIMRSGDRLTQQMTAFMGEPLMALNLMLRSYDNVRYAKTKEQRGAAIRQLGRAVVTLAVTDLVNSAVQSLVDALRKDDKDKDYWDRFMTALTGLEGDEKTAAERLKNIYLEGNFADNASLIGRIPLAKDLRSILQGFTVERLDAGAISDLMQSAQQLASGKYAPVYGAYRVAEQAAKIVGIPATNLERDAHAAVRSIIYAIGDPKLLYEYEKAIFNSRSTKNKSRFFATAYMALEQGDTATYEAIRNDLVDKMGVSAKDVDDDMKSRYNKAVKEDGAYTLPQASADLLALRQKYSVKTETEEEKFKAEDLGAAVYTRYSNQRARDYKTYKDALEKTTEFRKLSAEDKDRALNWAYSLADEMALEENSDGQYKITDKWKTYAKDAERYGISMTNYLTFHMVAETTSSTRDKNGKEVKGQKKADKMRDWLENRRGLTDGQRAWLWGTIYSSEW